MDEAVGYTLLVLDVIVTVCWVAHLEFKFRTNNRKETRA